MKESILSHVDDQSTAIIHGKEYGLWFYSFELYDLNGLKKWCYHRNRNAYQPPIRNSENKIFSIE
ncbi:6807_t:CDS:1, partial [Racocetra persica]